jgi:hypothetical protein
MAMSPESIWNYAVESKLSDKWPTKGKTPGRTISANLYIDIRDNEDSIFVQVGRRPARFGLKRMKYSEDRIEKERDDTADEGCNERDLHPLLVKFVRNDPNFRCRCRTIFHEKSSKGKKGTDRWLHPDIVGIHFAFEEFSQKTMELMEKFEENANVFFSFELKKVLQPSNYRECFFQALSNSEWANEGYLVTLHIEDEETVLEGMGRLHNAFGIGLIKLNPDSVEDSTVIIPANPKDVLNWDGIDTLFGKNRDFESFVQGVIDDLSVKKVRSEYDKVLSDEDMADHVLKKKIKE